MKIFNIFIIVAYGILTMSGLSLFFKYSDTSVLDQTWYYMDKQLKKYYQNDIQKLLVKFLKRTKISLISVCQLYILGWPPFFFSCKKSSFGKLTQVSRRKTLGMPNFWLKNFLINQKWFVPATLNKYKGWEKILLKVNLYNDI